MNIFIACRQLLKYIQIPKLRIQIGRKLIAQACEQPILIKVVVHNIFARIDMELIVQKDKRAFPP